MRFRGEYYFLSNFYLSPVTYQGLTYESSENAFQAMKCKDISQRVLFTNISPGEAKRKGKQVDLREDWIAVREQLMYEIVKEKFIQNQILQKRLLDTKDIHIQEDNLHRDTYWGVYLGIGQNKLGYILMKVRQELKHNTQ